MKNNYILIVLIIAATLYGCRSVQKAQTSKQSTSEVVEDNSAVSSHLAVIDSTGAGRHTIDTKMTTDSGYTRTTITKEYFSDEFGLSPDSSSNIHMPVNTPQGEQPPGTKPGRLLYREITTVEQGKLAKTEEKALSAEQSAHVKKIDSVGVASAQQHREVVSDTWISWKVIRNSIAGSWLFWLLIAAVVAYLIYLCLKKIV